MSVSVWPASSWPAVVNDTLTTPRALGKELTAVHRRLPVNMPAEIASVCIMLGPSITPVAAPVLMNAVPDGVAPGGVVTLPIMRATFEPGEMYEEGSAFVVIVRTRRMESHCDDPPTVLLILFHTRASAMVVTWTPEW